MHQRYGPFVRLSPNEVSVSSPAACKHIYAISSRYEKIGWYTKFAMDDPPGLFTMTNIHEHAQRRKLFAKAFSMSHLRLQWESTVKELALFAVNRIKEEAKREGIVNTMKWWTCMTADISGHLMFGEDFHNLQTGKVSEPKPPAL